DVAGCQIDRWSIDQLDDCAAVDNEMIEDQVFRTLGEFARGGTRRRRRKTPGSRELRAEENCAVQPDAAQDFRECIHGVLWSFDKVRWPLRKESACVATER